MHATAMVLGGHVYILYRGKLPVLFGQGHHITIHISANNSFTCIGNDSRSCSFTVSLPFVHVIPLKNYIHVGRKQEEVVITWS